MYCQYNTGIFQMIDIAIQKCCYVMIQVYRLLIFAGKNYSMQTSSYNDPIQSRTCMIWMTFISGFAIKAINTVITQWNSYLIKYKSCYSITVTANFTKQMQWYFFFLSNTMDSDVKHGLLDIAG